MNHQRWEKTNEKKTPSFLCENFTCFSHVSHAEWEPEILPSSNSERRDGPFDGHRRRALCLRLAIPEISWVHGEFFREYLWLKALLRSYQYFAFLIFLDMALISMVSPVSYSWSHHGIYGLWYLQNCTILEGGVFEPTSIYSMNL